MVEKIQFVATLPPIQSAVKIGGGEGEGARIQLDVPGTEIAAITTLSAFCRGKVFQVTVELTDEV
jgi:hypothetical protein